MIKCGYGLDQDLAESHGRTLPTTRILNLETYETDVTDIPESNSVLITIRQHLVDGRSECPGRRTWERLQDGHQMYSDPAGITLTWGRESRTGTATLTSTGHG